MIVKCIRLDCGKEQIARRWRASLGVERRKIRNIKKLCRPKVMDV